MPLRITLSAWPSGSAHQLPQYERQDASVLVVVDFDRRVDADDQRGGFRRSVCAMNDQRRFLAGAEIAGDAGDVEGLGAIEGQRLRVCAFFELQREDAHADQVRT